MCRVLKNIFVGPNIPLGKKPRSAIRVQCAHLRNVWTNRKTPTFGIERILRFFLVIIQFILPVLYIREISGLRNALNRKIAVELYVLLKLLIPIIILIQSWDNCLVSICVISYLMFDTLVYLLGIIFLSDIYVRPISFKRSLILIFTNYVEITLGFAVLYKGLETGTNLPDWLSAIYFSFVTGMTIGYGEFKPATSVGKILVIIQSLVFLLFIVIFFSHFVSNVSQNALVRKNNRPSKKGKN